METIAMNVLRHDLSSLEVYKTNEQTPLLLFVWAHLHYPKKRLPWQISEKEIIKRIDNYKLRLNDSELAHIVAMEELIKPNVGSTTARMAKELIHAMTMRHLHDFGMMGGNEADTDHQMYFHIMLFLLEVLDPNEMKVRELNSSGHAMLLFHDEKNRKWFISNSGSGLQNHATFESMYNVIQEIIPDHEFMSLVRKNTKTISFSRVDDIYEQLNLVSPPPPATTKKYTVYSMSRMIFSYHQDAQCLYASPQLGGTCTFYCNVWLLVYRLLTTSQHGAVKIGLYIEEFLKYMRQHVASPIQVVSTPIASKGYTLQHVLCKENRQCDKTYDKLVLDYHRRIYGHNLTKTDYLIREDPKLGLDQIWDQTNEFETFAWLFHHEDSRLRMGADLRLLMNGLYVKQACHHWQSKSMITDTQFPLVLRFLRYFCTSMAMALSSHQADLFRMLHLTFGSLWHNYITSKVGTVLVTNIISDILRNDVNKEDIIDASVKLQLKLYHDTFATFVIAGKLHQQLGYNNMFIPPLVKNEDIGKLLSQYKASPTTQVTEFSPLLIPVYGDMKFNTKMVSIEFGQVVLLPKEQQDIEMSCVRHHFEYLKFHDIPESNLHLYMGICIAYNVTLQLSNVLIPNLHKQLPLSTLPYYYLALLLCRDDKQYTEEWIMDQFIRLTLPRNKSQEIYLYYLYATRKSSSITLLWQQCSCSSAFRKLHMTSDATSTVEEPLLQLVKNTRTWFYDGDKVEPLNSFFRFPEDPFCKYGYMIRTQKNNVSIVRYRSTTPSIPSHNWYSVTPQQWHLHHPTEGWFTNYSQVISDPLLHWSCHAEAASICLMYHTSHPSRRGLLLYYTNSYCHDSYIHQNETYRSQIHTDPYFGIIEFTSDYTWFKDLSITDIVVLYRILAENHNINANRVYEVASAYDPLMYGGSYMIDYLNKDSPKRILPQDWITYWDTHYIRLFTPRDTVSSFWGRIYPLTPTPAQKDVIEALEKGAAKGPNCVIQLLMGMGKSSIIMPYLLVNYLQNATTLPQLHQQGLYIVVVQPRHLTKDALQKIITFNFIPWVIVRYGITDQLLTRRKSHVVIHVVSDTDLKRLYLKLKPNEFIPDMMIIDEYDSICMPCKSDYNEVVAEQRGYSCNTSLSPKMLHWFQHRLPQIIMTQRYDLLDTEQSEYCDPGQERLFTHWKTCVHTIHHQWIYRVKYGFRHTGPKASLFVVPYIAMDIPHESSEFSSNDVNFIATCMALRHEGHLTREQQRLLKATTHRRLKLRIIQPSDDKNNPLCTYASECLFPQLHYSTIVNNITMVDILRQKHGIVYAFSGTVAIPSSPQLNVTCVTKDQSYSKVIHILESNRHKMRCISPKTNLWADLKHYNVFIDACGYCKDHSQQEIIELLHEHVKCSIVYVNSQHITMVYPENHVYSETRTSNTFDMSKSYFYFFDHTHIVGTDIKHPRKLRILLMTHESLREYQVVQAMYRIRGIDVPTNEHDITFAYESLTPNNSLVTIWRDAQHRDIQTNAKYLDILLLRNDKKIAKKSYQIMHEDCNDQPASMLELEQEKENEKEVENEVEIDTYHVKLTIKRVIRQNHTHIDNQGRINYNASSNEISFGPHTFLSKYCKEFVRENYITWYDLFILEHYPKSIIIHYDELYTLWGKLLPNKHKVFHATGHLIYPTASTKAFHPMIATMLYLSSVTSTHLTEIAKQISVPSEFKNMESLCHMSRPLSHTILFSSNADRKRLFYTISQTSKEYTHKYIYPSSSILKPASPPPPPPAEAPITLPQVAMTMIPPIVSKASPIIINSSSSSSKTEPEPDLTHYYTIPKSRIPKVHRIDGQLVVSPSMQKRIRKYVLECLPEETIRVTTILIHNMSHDLTLTKYNLDQTNVYGYIDEEELVQSRKRRRKVKKLVEKYTDQPITHHMIRTIEHMFSSHSTFTRLTTTMKLAAGLLDDSLQKSFYLVSHHFPNVEDNIKRNMAKFVVTHAKSGCLFSRLSSTMKQKLIKSFLM